MKTLTIDRGKWARGGHNGLPALLNDDGNQCCLGFAALQITGLSEEQIDGCGLFSEIDTKHWDWLFENGTPFVEPFEDEFDYGPVAHDTWFHDQAVELNDKVIGETEANCHGMIIFVDSEEDREEKLAALFATVDIELEFTGPPR